jgi:hypothetical protein
MKSETKKALIEGLELLLWGCFLAVIGCLFKLYIDSLPVKF